MTIPEQCRHCYKYHRKTVELSCSFCQNIGFTEQLLCDITRDAQQDAEEFQCAASRPHLMVVRPQSADQENAATQQKPTHNIMKSEKVKWMLAYAKQQLAMNPDLVIYDMKFHVCLPTAGRRQLFQLQNDDIDHLSGIVKESSGFFAGSANFLTLGLDHLHIYLESTPDESVEEIMQHIMAHTESGLRDILGKDAPAQGKMFQGYFVETLG